MQGHLKELFSLDLGAAGLPSGFVADWSPPVDGRRWAIGRRSSLTLPRPQVDGDMVLVLTMDPFTCAALPRQVMRVLVNGVTVRLAQFSARSVIACIIPHALAAAREQMTLQFEHPDLIQPNMVSDSSDDRRYSVGFVGLSLASWDEGEDSSGTARAPAPPRPLPPAEELSDEALLMHFASIGDNCEFGMVQRYAKAEPMDLLRFAAMPFHNLAGGLASGFEGIDRLDELQFSIYEAGGRREYVLHQRRYELQSHTSVDEGQMGTVRLLGRERRKLDVLGRLFRSDLAEAQRMFVFKRNDIQSSLFVEPLLKGLRAWGPNTLLHVVQGGEHPPGYVEVVAEGLLRGYVDRFNGYDNAAAPPSAAWMGVCRNSYALWRERRLGYSRRTGDKAWTTPLASLRTSSGVS